MTRWHWDEDCTPEEARAVLGALGVLDRDVRAVVACTPVEPCSWVQDLRGLCPRVRDLGTPPLCTPHPLAPYADLREPMRGLAGAPWCGGAPWPCTDAGCGNPGWRDRCT